MNILSEVKIGLQRIITVLNFDGTLELQKKYLCIPYNWVNFKDVQGTKLFCAEKSFYEIALKLQELTKYGIYLIGSGDFHYVSYILLAKIDLPFTLLLFDNHSDLITSTRWSPLFSCSSWVAKALELLPNLEKVVIIGARPDTFCNVDPNLLHKVVYIPYYPVDQYQCRDYSRLSNFLNKYEPIAEQGMHAAILDLLSVIPTDAVYISIDKDVLDKKYAITNWDQGKILIDDLLVALQDIVTVKKVCGLDICGEMPVDPVAMVRIRYREAVKKNAMANLKILKTIFKHRVYKHVSNL